MKTIDPSTLKVTVKTPDGRKIPARVYWAEPKKVVKTIVRSAEGMELAVIMSPEFETADGENFAEALENFDGPEYDCPQAEAFETDLVRLSGTLTLDIP